MQYVTSVRIANKLDTELRFDLEPWGEQYQMPPGAVFTVVARSPGPGHYEIQVAKGRITVFGWEGSTVELFRNGEVLGAHSGEPRPTPPPTPPRPRT